MPNDGLPPDDDLARGFTREPPLKLPDDSAGDSVNIIVADDPLKHLDPNSGALQIEVGDGSVIVDFDPDTSEDKGDVGFDGNLVDHLSQEELGRISSELFQAIEADDQSRSEWLMMRAKGIDLFGFKLEEPRGDAGASSAPVEGMSVVRHPLLTEAVIRFQSNASAELLPAGGPVKVRNDSGQAPPPVPLGTTPSQAGIGHNGGPPLDGAPGGIAAPPPGMSSDDLAEALEIDFNHYLTAIDKGYRADTDRMLFWVGYGGVGFKKVYHCPIKRMPLSRSVDAKDLIVSNNAHDLDDCGRVTHRIPMRKSTLKRMQIAGVYKDLENLAQPQQQPNAVDQKQAQVQGFAPIPQRPDDMDYTIYECYTELDIKGFEHKDEDGKVTGLAVPYRVSIDKDSQQILEIRRNWKEGDPDCLAKKVFVKYPFVPAFGFYEVGLLHILGNAAKALTAAWRLMLDAGMFASFPGFLYTEAVGRQLTNEFRIPPGGGMRIQTGGQPIGAAVMPLPYKDMTVGLGQLTKEIEVTAQRVGGTAELQVGEGRQDAPVGTTLALIEQATKMLAAVHIRLHAAQSEEFQLLKERFKEDPKAFFRHNKKAGKDWQEQEFLAALADCDLVPAADPNIASHMQRIMNAVAIKQLQAMNPALYDGKAVDLRIMHMIGLQDVDALFAPPPDPNAQPMGIPPDPNKLMELSVKKQQQDAENAAKAQQQQFDAAQAQQEGALKARTASLESADRAADRESRERVAQTREETERLRLQGEQQRHQQQLAQTAQHKAMDLQHEASQAHADRAFDHAQNQQENAMQHQQNQQDHALQSRQNEHDMLMSHQERQDKNQLEQQKLKQQAAMPKNPRVI